MVPAPRPPEFRNAAVELVRRRERPVRELAVSLGISESCLRNWVHQADIAASAIPRQRTEEHTELVALRRERREQRLTAEILKRAVAHFAREDMLPK